MTEALLDAGAVLPLGSTVDKPDTVDTLTVRAYRHAVLGERPVVRLVPGMLGQAEDLAMDFLGLKPDEDSTPAEVGLVRQQALGFPAWALVNDPANGHHALALVKEMEKLARGAKSKIGPARDGFNALGERLARAVPHFLPTFYEEAGRAFVAAESPTYAATMFGKAREAEEVFGLAIDEERLHAVFLEFALAGALTAKALSGHARTLAARSGSVEAYDRFLRLCLERTLGGLPPYATMHTDLRRLAKAAKLDQAEADDEVVRRLLDAPATARAPEGFWTGYQSSLTRIGAAEPRFRGVLLGMFPQNCGDLAWITVLRESGAADALVGPAGAAPAEAQSPDGPAGWLHRIAARREGRYYRERKRLQELQTLAADMAGRLIADGEPVKLAENHWDVDLDLIDECLAAGIPVADPADNIRVHIDEWLDDDKPGRRDLTALAADERFLPHLVSGVESFLKPRYSSSPRIDPLAVQRVVAVAGLRRAVHAWQERLAGEVGALGLPNLPGQLTAVTALACAEGFAVNPEAVRRILDTSVPALLGRTLRTGLLDEYGWPALEEAVARLSEGVKPTDDARIYVVRQWPQLILRRGDLVLVVGPDGIELEHMLRIPAAERSYWWLLVLNYVDGQLLVSWDRGPDRANYWTGSPDDVFITSDRAFSRYSYDTLPAPGGGRSIGGRVLRVGDRTDDATASVISDGVTYWRCQNVEGKLVLIEFDPVTGTAGRASLPSFFEDAGPDAEALSPWASWLAPVPAIAGADPLGGAGGLVGWRAAADGHSGRAVDGREFRATTTPEGWTATVLGAMTFPGSDRVRGLVRSRNNNDATQIVDDSGFAVGEYTVDSRNESYARGTRMVLPARWWHFLRVRDEAGSAALRAVTDEVAAALMAEIDAVYRAAEEEQKVDRDAVRAVVTRLLPEVTDTGLVDGIVGVVREAVRHDTTFRQLAGVLEGRPLVEEKPAVKEEPTRPGSDVTLQAGLQGMIPYCYNRGHSALDMFTAIGPALTGAVDTLSLASLDRDWFDAFAALPGAMFRAVATLTHPDEREALLLFLEAVAGSGLLDGTGRLRRVTMIAAAKPTYAVGQVVPIDGHRFLILSIDNSDNEVYAIEWAPDGVFRQPTGHKLTHERQLTDGSVSAERIAELVALVRANGPVPWRPELIDTLSQRAGMTRAEAAVVLYGLPTSNAWDREESVAHREPLGIAEAAFTTARTRWGQLGTGTNSTVLASLLPADLTDLWSGGLNIDGLVAWWVERHGERTPVDDSIVVTVQKAQVNGRIHTSELVHGIANPHTCKWLAGPSGGYDVDDVLVALARMIPWMSYHLPVDSPIREQLPAVVEKVRALIADPSVALPAGYLNESKIAPLIKALHAGTPVDGPHGREIGPLIVPPGSGWHRVLLRPALVNGMDDPVMTVLRARLDSVDDENFAAVRALLSPQLPKLVAYTPPDPEAGAPQDPSRSAPELVAEVAEKTGLSADAATLYLQLLALPDPTDRNVAAWTGWKPARLKKARAELAETDLVVAAKRARAGRGLFIPGGWLALGAPHLPLERWKLSMLIGDESGISELHMVLPVSPPPALFELAWDRVRNGDAPRFDELVTERRR
ncbi:hypothetical protein Val02_43600 [Virgisporangium aliadipatigenens]|uniref:DNA-binding protein n=1 Tax=Virgisporangium aliadipatigenens TaxID=741659 RepID=A0A8J3YL43_9ACTN|nr:hypothetical protein [Virgisporangium aliadipatigenens]GIJ47474.1 hypothetical protein Val02_43600 [Virgisporangium aliadipatigenens]